MPQGRILVADAAQDVVVDLSRCLRNSGYEVLVASDGFSATKQAINEQPDLILMDIGLPGGDSWIAADRLRYIGSTDHIPIVFLVDRDVDPGACQARDGNVFAVITKPLIADEILATVAGHLPGVH